jgi:hypothetical protein
MDTMPATVAKDAENLQDAGEPDSFPPEGTDEATLDPDARHVLEQDQRLKATRAVIKAGY